MRQRPGRSRSSRSGDAVLIVDETADEKSSADGAARQYSGTVGGIAPCQVAVTPHPWEARYVTWGMPCFRLGATFTEEPRQRLPAAARPSAAGHASGGVGAIGVHSMG